MKAPKHIAWRAAAVLTVLPVFGAPALAGGNSTTAQYEQLFGQRGKFSADSSAFYKLHGVMKRYKSEKENPTPGWGKEHAEWQTLVESLKNPKLGLHTKLEAVNTAINKHPYVPSFVNWHESSYWETPFEFLRKGGQCEDYAIAKYLALLEAGVPVRNLQMVAVRINLSEYHAILIVRTEGGTWVLDNLYSKVMPAQSIDHYAPLYAINGKGVAEFQALQLDQAINSARAVSADLTGLLRSYYHP